MRERERRLAWLGLLVGMLLLVPTGMCRVPDEIFHRLSELLKVSLGTEQMIYLQEVSSLNDARFAPVLIGLLDDRLSREAVVIVRKELHKYASVAEPLLIDYLNQPIPPLDNKFDAVEMLARMKSTKAIPTFLKMMHDYPERVYLRKTIEVAMLELGDASVPVLVDLLADETLGDYAERYLHSAISTAALKAELNRRGIQLSEYDAGRLANSDGTLMADGSLVSDFLIAKFHAAAKGEPAPRTRPAPAPKDMPLDQRLVRLAREQFIEKPNLFFISAVALTVLLILFVLTQIVFPKIFPRRQLNRKIGQIERLIHKREWESALTLAERLSVKHISPALIEARARELKGRVYVLRAEEAMEKSEFKAAQRDYEAYARMTHKDPAAFQKKVTDRKVEYLTEFGWKSYTQGLLGEAQPTFQAILQDDFSNPRAHFALGLIFLEKHELLEAVEEFRHAKNYANIEAPDYDLYLAVAFGRLTEYASSLDTLLTLIERNESALSLLYFAKFALALGAHLGQVKRSLERLIIEAGSMSLRGRASVMAQLEANYSFRCRVTGNEADHPAGAAHYFLGHVYAKLGSADEAQEHFQLAAEKGYQGGPEEV